MADADSLQGIQRYSNRLVKIDRFAQLFRAFLGSLYTTGNAGSATPMASLLAGSHEVATSLCWKKLSAICFGGFVARYCALLSCAGLGAITWNVGEKRSRGK